MVREKLRATLVWSAMCVAIAMIVDYVVTMLLLHNSQGYTPFITLTIASLVSFPTTYILVNAKYNLRKAHDELAAARDAAVEANRFKTNFFANMSHELRTPLNAIIGFSQLLETDIFAARRVEYARLICDSGRHLLDLVNDLLDVSKIEAGKIELDSGDVTLEAMLAESCQLIEPRLRTGCLHLVQRYSKGLPPVIADERALKQIALNLLTNAIKFSSPGGTIEVFATRMASGEMVFGVRDEGIGIKSEDQAQVFERYGRAQHQTAHALESTGLGLAIVKGLAEAHGGRVVLQSEPGRGTCVTVWLPASRVGPQPSQALAS